MNLNSDEKTVLELIATAHFKNQHNKEVNLLHNLEDLKDLSPLDDKRTKYIVRRLSEKGLIRTKPNLMDMRSVFYKLNMDESNVFQIDDVPDTVWDIITNASQISVSAMMET